MTAWTFVFLLVLLRDLIPHRDIRVGTFYFFFSLLTLTLTIPLVSPVSHMDGSVILVSASPILGALFF